MESAEIDRMDKVGVYSQSDLFVHCMVVRLLALDLRHATAPQYLSVRSSIIAHNRRLSCAGRTWCGARL